MGYETTLYIGRQGYTSEEVKKGEMTLEDGEISQEWLKDKDNNHIHTGRKQTSFCVYAKIDLCKCGSDSHIGKIDRINKDESHYWFWYENSDIETIEDCYGEMMKPIPIKTVVEALRKDSKSGPYRRFEWALALLEAMQDDQEKLEVMIYGH